MHQGEIDGGGGGGKRGDGADIDGVKGRFTGGIINDPDRIGTNIITKKTILSKLFRKT